MNKDCRYAIYETVLTVEGSYGAVSEVSHSPSAFAAAAVSALAVGPLIPEKSFAGSAAAPAAYQGTAACAKYADTDRAIPCEADELDRRTAAANQATDCTKFLISGVKQGLFTKSAALTVANGKLTPLNACEVTRQFGYGQKAELSSPSVR